MKSSTPRQRSDVSCTEPGTPSAACSRGTTVPRSWGQRRSRVARLPEPSSGPYGTDPESVDTLGRCAKDHAPERQRRPARSRYSSRRLSELKSTPHTDRMPKRTYRASVTFEYGEQAPETARVEIVASNASIAASRSVREARRQLPGRRPSSIVVLVEAAEGAS